MPNARRGPRCRPPSVPSPYLGRVTFKPELCQLSDGLSGVTRGPASGSYPTVHPMTYMVEGRAAAARAMIAASPSTDVLDCFFGRDVDGLCRGDYFAPIHGAPPIISLLSVDAESVSSALRSSVVRGSRPGVNREALSGGRRSEARREVPAAGRRGPESSPGRLPPTVPRCGSLGISRFRHSR